MTGTCSTPDAKTAVPIGRTPFLGENPRPAKMFLDTGIEQVAGHVSREGHWGWDGACLESVSAIAHDPLEADINLYRYCANNPLLYTDPTGKDWLDCMSACIKDNDPLPYALGAGIKAVLLTGGWETKAMVAQMFKALGYTDLAADILHYANMPGASKLTNIMSTIGTVLSKMGTTQSTAMWHKLGGAASSILGPIEVAYGLSLAAIETHCAGWCCTAWWYGIPYNHADGNVINAWKNYYFGKWL